MTLDRQAAQRARWDATFAPLHHALASDDAAEHWLERLLLCEADANGRRALEIGCGRGADTFFLANMGYGVTALDISRVALCTVRDQIPSVRPVEAALPDSLPFRDASFGLVVAGLSLHYFSWDDTRRIVADIHRVLCPEGVLLFQVNSTEDAAHGAGRGVEIEPNLWEHEGWVKRFFDEEDCRRLFAEGWKIEHLERQIVTRFGPLKHTWFGRCVRR